jgi:hypothetical protein
MRCCLVQTCVLARVYRYSTTAAPPCAEMTQLQQLFKYQQVGEGGRRHLPVCDEATSAEMAEQGSSNNGSVRLQLHILVCSQQGKMPVKSFSSVVIL